MRPAAGLAQELILDSTRIRNELGFNEPIPPEMGIRRAVEWMLGNPPTADDPMGRLELDYRAEDVVLAAH